MDYEKIMAEQQILLLASSTVNIWIILFINPRVSCTLLDLPVAVMEYLHLRCNPKSVQNSCFLQKKKHTLNVAKLSLKISITPGLNVKDFS